MHIKHILFTQNIWNFAKYLMDIFSVGKFHDKLDDLVR